jgi:hypothetical protein
VTWRNWRRRAFAPAVAEAGLAAGTRPYDLRHSFVSLLLEGATVVEVARQAGHSPTMTLSTYAHLFEELEGAETRSAEDEIRRAPDAARGSRTRFVPATGSKATGPGGKLLQILKSRRPDSNRGPFITSYGPLSPPVTESHPGSLLAPTPLDWR